MQETIAGGTLGVLQQTFAAGDSVRLREDAVWVDLLDPTPEQDREVLARLGVDIPTREEMEEIESSSRVYEQGGIAYMTALVVHRVDTDKPENTPVSFILTPTHLVTVRFADMAPFRTFTARCARQPQRVEGSAAAFAGLLEAIVDRTADVLERADAELAAISAEIFEARPPGAKRVSRPPRDMDDVVTRIGRYHDKVSAVRESLLTLQRVVMFARQVADAWLPENARAKLKIAERDVRSLLEHDGHLTQKVSFLLDATLGLINNEQNKIIKIFSVVAVVFLPPTLIASIYGMNFEYMPELAQRWGYPASLVLMVISAISPYLYFRQKGWL